MSDAATEQQWGEFMNSSYDSLVNLSIKLNFAPLLHCLVEPKVSIMSYYSDIYIIVIFHVTSTFSHAFFFFLTNFHYSIIYGDLKFTSLVDNVMLGSFSDSLLITAENKKSPYFVTPIPT